MLRPLLGLNENNQLEIYINPWGKLNKLSPMHERGAPFPRLVHDITDESAIAALRAIGEYFQKAEEATIPRGGKEPKSQVLGGLKFGDIPPRIRKRK